VLSHVEGAILAGGASTRMGRDKATLPFEGTALAERVARALGQCFARVRVVLRPGAPSPLALERIDDLRALRAPIVGVEAALAACRASAVLVAACDLPAIDPRLVLALAALVPAEGGADVVAPLGPRGPEPLLSIFRPRILPEVSRRIDRGDLSLQSLLAAVDALYVPESDLRALDPDLASLRNVNRPEDLA
jgi:molybdopterin-guanine dinucleotide biosynthesis protein A